MILTYASCRVTVDLNDLTTPRREKRRQPSGQRALDTLTAYITVNVAIDAVDAGKRLKGGELTRIEQKTRAAVEISSSTNQIKRSLYEKLHL